ncbi:hypothetical protein Celaphus_00014664, partial [Cervus elaphus hippelaphus]
ATVLECMIKNSKKGLGGDYGVKMKPNCLHILCEVEWTPMGAGWPPENTVNLKIVEAIYTVATGEPGHLDQYPSIDSWLGLKERVVLLAEIFRLARQGLTCSQQPFHRLHPLIPPLPPPHPPRSILSGK